MTDDEMVDKLIDRLGKERAHVLELEGQLQRLLEPLYYEVRIDSRGSGEDFSRLQEFDSDGCIPEDFKGKVVNEMWAVVKVHGGHAQIVDDGYPTYDEARLDWCLRGRTDGTVTE